MKPDNVCHLVPILQTETNCVPGGAMENLDRKWILVKDTKCPEKDTSPATLGLTNMAGKKTV